MLVLGIESSATAASVAVAEGEKLLGQYYCNTAMTHSQTLLPMAEALVQSLGKTWADFGLLAVSAGPGSFTGVRIGVSCVKGIAFAHNIPCCGVSTLEAIAYNGLACEGNILCAVMDARCGQVYNALFQVEKGALRRLTEDRALAIEALAEECKGYGPHIMLLGDGAALCHQAFSTWGARLAPEAQRFQQAASVAFIGQQRAQQGLAVPAAELLPAYLRLPQAERELKRKKEKEGN